MSADQVADLLGTLATAGVVALVGIAVLALVHRPSLEALRRGMQGYGPALASVFAVVATAGSLWFSEGAGFPPCRLCWFQRIAMYPLAVLLPLAAVRRDAGMRFYGIVLGVIGGAISTYHILIELYPSWESGSCDPTNPCSLRWVEGLGFWTIPRMALVAFALVVASLLLDRGSASDETGEESGEESGDDSGDMTQVPTAR